MYEEIDDAIRVAEARNEEGFVGCVTVRLDVLKLWRAQMKAGRPEQAPCEHEFGPLFCWRCGEAPRDEPGALAHERAAQEQAPQGARKVGAVHLVDCKCRECVTCIWPAQVMGEPRPVDTTKPEEPESDWPANGKRPW